MNSSDVRAYYERNTRLFLALGTGRRARAIHRAVWANGVTTAEQALHYTDRLVLEALRQLSAAQPNEAAHVIDLGCGVGGSLFYLAAHLDFPFHATGITISPLQAALAREHAARLGAQARCAFVDADFMNLPDLPPADLVFSIEAFIHSPDPGRYFEQAARVVKPRGRLMVCDDFLSERGAASGLPPREQTWLRAFQDGWRAPGLLSVARAVELAELNGFGLVNHLNLTPHLKLLNWKDGVAHALVRLGRALWMPWAYWHSTVGSLALQQCLKTSLVEYRFLTFERRSHPE